MKLIIAGSRTFNFYESKHAIDTSYIDSCRTVLNIPWPEEVVCGCGGTSKKKTEKLIKDKYFVSDQGIDRLGEYWAHTNSVKIKRFPPDWDLQGKSAGPIRNRQMAEYADALLLIWGGKSNGSRSMKEEMLKLNKPIFEVVLRKI